MMWDLFWQFVSYNADVFLTTSVDNISSAAWNSKYQISLGGWNNEQNTYEATAVVIGALYK